MSPVATPSATKVVTGVVRLSYVHIFEPWAMNETDDKKFSCVILVPKTDTSTINKIKKAQKAALEEGRVKRFGGSIPKNWKNTFRDGDEEADLEKNPEYEGHYFMSTSSSTRPGVVDRSLNEVMDKELVYSGCYARVSMNAFPFNNQSKGVSFGLENIMLWADGERLSGGRSKAEDDFAEFADEDDDDEDDDLI